MPPRGLTGYVGIQIRSDLATKDVVVDAPLKGSPADKAGLKKDDVVLRVGGSAVADLNGTIEAVRKSKPGDKLVVKVRRDGKEVDVTVPVGVFPFPWAVGLE